MATPTALAVRQAKAAEATANEIKAMREAIEALHEEVAALRADLAKPDKKKVSDDGDVYKRQLLRWGTGSSGCCATTRNWPKTR